MSPSVEKKKLKLSAFKFCQVLYQIWHFLGLHSLNKYRTKIFVNKFHN